VAERMIEANGVELCAESFGDPADTAILLVMGLLRLEGAGHGVYRADWEAIIAAILEHT
jgi:hypothetical protein